MVTVMQYRPGTRAAIKMGESIEDRVKRLVKEVTPHSWGNHKYVSTKDCWSGMTDCHRKESVMTAIYKEGWDAFGVPPGILLEKYYAADVTPIFRGWSFAIDITTKTHDHSIDKKMVNLNRLSHLKVAGGIDRAALWVVSTKDFPSVERIREIMKRMVKQSTFVGAYYL